jgi:hypothetical protein
MIVTLLLLLAAVWLTWVLFRDEHSAEKTANRVGSQEQNERDREQRADE